MAEDKKEIIYKFLRLIPNQRINISQIHSMVKEKMSYSTVLKWILVLQAENKISIEDYGNLKLVKLNLEYKDE